MLTWLMHLPGAKSHGVGKSHWNANARTDDIVQRVMVARTARVDQRIILDGVTDVTSHEREILEKHNDRMTSIWLA